MPIFLIFHYSIWMQVPKEIVEPCHGGIPIADSKGNTLETAASAVASGENSGQTLFHSAGRSWYRRDGGGTSSSIHLPAVTTDRVPIQLQICAWMGTDDSSCVVFNLTRSVVEQQHHVPILFIGDR